MKQSCSYKTSNTINLIINIILHVLILFSFLTILYFSVIAPLEKKSFEDEIKNQIKSSLSEQLTDFKNESEYTEQICNIVNTKIQDENGNEVPIIDQLINNLSDESPIITEHNKWITGTAISIISILLIGVIIYINTLSSTCCKQMNIGYIIKENIITFIFIGIVEYLFFTQIAFKYIPAPPSTLVNSLINNFKDSLIK